ncbi:hypothetical protein BV898_17867 [Hypsibius exemplaris]|uniref:Tyr recombinase domain-containing protein n=1 Tax=Hypsibius exemplaris TaxID=2072580 RepID=A0A9X6NIP5_HYPEX|nr:hypothetical protein BV898_17867 [Hypsibius exemplaris]
MDCLFCPPTIYECILHSQLWRFLRRSTVTLYLRHSKTDAINAGKHIVLHATNPSICPVKAIRQFFSYRQHTSTSPEHPFFTFSDGSFFSTSSFSQALKTFLKHIPEPQRYSTHSFRIGAAITAAKNHTAEHVIQKAGRWKSDTYRRYIRQPDISKHLTFY